MHFRGMVAGLLATSMLAMASPAVAQKSSDTLRILFTDAVPSIDPYFNAQRTGLILGHQAWDMLVHRDPVSFEIKPALATAWKWVDDKTLDFTIREGVKFHDGSVLSADDVVYTINMASDPASKVATPSNYAWIEKAAKVDDKTVRVTMKKPTPAALEYFALVIPIHPKAYREKVGAEGFAKAPVGAGPYKIVKLEQAKEVWFERFDDYWKGSPKGTPRIGKLHVRFVSETATQMTELLGGRADWIWNVNPDQFDNVNRVPTLTAVRKESMRIGYLSIDGAGRSGAGNPLTNVKVRKAIWHAIDRQQMADKLITGGSRVPAAPCFPTQFGCDQDAAVKYDYNPAKAKELLKEAGFPDGFEIEFVTYVQPTQWSAAIQNYLQAVGIRAKITQLQVAAAIQKAWRGENPLYHGSWGSYSINDVSAIMPVMFGGGNDDYTRDPEMIKLLEQGGSTSDPAVRKAAYSAAIKRATENAYWLPLFTYVSTFAHTKQLDFTPYADELPRFYMYGWK